MWDSFEALVTALLGVGYGLLRRLCGSGLGCQGDIVCIRTGRLNHNVALSLYSPLLLTFTHNLIIPNPSLRHPPLSASSSSALGPNAFATPQNHLSPFVNQLEVNRHSTTHVVLSHRTEQANPVSIPLPLETSAPHPQLPLPNPQSYRSAQLAGMSSKDRKKSAPRALRRGFVGWNREGRGMGGRSGEVVRTFVALSKIRGTVFGAGTDHNVR